MTYFLTEEPQYHRRNFVSRSCSGWEGVVPKRYGRQTVTCMPARFLGVQAKLEGKLGSECVIRDVLVSHVTEHMCSEL